MKAFITLLLLLVGNTFYAQNDTIYVILDKKLGRNLSPTKDSLDIENGYWINYIFRNEYLEFTFVDGNQKQINKKVLHKANKIDASKLLERELDEVTKIFQSKIIFILDPKQQIKNTIFVSQATFKTGFYPM